MPVKQVTIDSKKITAINGVKSITIPQNTDVLYYSFHGRWDGNLSSWKNITEYENEPINYNKYLKFYILNYTTSSKTITWEQMDDLLCSDNTACHSVVVEFVPIPISLTANNSDSDESENTYDNHVESGTDWISGSTSGIGWQDPSTSRWHTGYISNNNSGNNNGGNNNVGYSGSHDDWSNDPAVDDDPVQTISSIIRMKHACVVDDATLEVHMYNAIYSGFRVRYRYAVVDGSDNIYKSQYTSKDVDSIGTYILGLNVRDISNSLSVESVKYASIEVEIIPDANYSRSSFVSNLDTPINVQPYSQGITPHIELIGESVITLLDDEVYTDEGASYWDDGFPNAPHATIMSNGFTNTIYSVVMEYMGCGSQIITREVFNGKINNDGDELVFKQGIFNYIRYTDVEYTVKPKDGITFNYEHYQIYEIDDTNNVINTYSLDTNVTDSIELLSNKKRYTIKFFSGQTELEMLNDIIIESSPNSIPYTYSIGATIKNTSTGLQNNEHKLVYDVENYNIDFNNFIDSIEIVPLAGLTIPLDIEHYIISKQIIIKDKDNQIIYSETLANPLNQFNVNLPVLVADNTLNQNIITIDLNIINKNQLPFLAQNVVAIYEKYEQPTGTLRVLSDGSDVELRTIRNSVYASSGDTTNTYIENIGGMNELMIDLESYISNTISIEENNVSILNHDSSGLYGIIKDNSNFKIWNEPSPIIFFITDGFTTEIDRDIPIVLFNRSNSVLKMLFTVINGSSQLSSLDLVVTNLLNGSQYSYVGDIATHSYNISFNDILETGTLLCFEATATLDNGRKNTIRMIGKII